ncbi:hypothetical protein A2866_04280 [Candidatus Roizmanbacteria bacterium RIFCSPHIGHO2_01_FULL_39_8]|uniref:CAAX prenyl protease 2/Lysostaphin resistance protein A-like domain-containing protein n=1 Tax=Candidatus Roizmanbacteria bacterium RIFCSPHIGHO2_01_FULL_39_8 TaxID=1802033 RepID=A0A1F7GID0_9BACT|nr:MAG: hypothetical protein A2866_04280 [Candidatus Roizmanbacteria bacterium RIFCSPHIGHO2_01_FULL_39_8]
MKSKASPTQKTLNVWAIILIIWSVYRAKFRLPEWFDEFVAKPVVFVLPVLYYIKRYEKKDIFSALDIRLKLKLQDVLLVLSIGGIFAISAFMANFLKFHKVVLFQNPLQLQAFVYIIVMALVTGISEEILSRGFVLKRLYAESKNIYTASFFASVLFFFLHVPILFTNLKLTGNLLLMFMAMDMILSLVNSFVFLERKNLVLPILIHTFYNLTIILFL